MSTSQATIAFFGATGDCAGFCLAKALAAGHACTALARTPAKLLASMKEKGVSDQALTKLQIIQGDVRDESIVARALQINGQVVDTIVSGIGSLPALQWSIATPVTLRDPNICADAAATVVKALKSLNPSRKPNVVVISTTGLTEDGQPRDVPLAYVPLYRWLLHIPHEDKASMEKVMKLAVQEPTTSSPIASLTIVKPTLLVDGPSRGTDKLFVGTEDEPAIGYLIRKSEVGEWMFENLVGTHASGSYIGKTVCLTA